MLGAPHHRGGGEPEARPLQDLPQVVGVSAVGPQSGLDELPLDAEAKQIRFTARIQSEGLLGNKVPFTYSIVRIALENPLLLIGEGFGGEAEGP